MLATEREAFDDVARALAERPLRVVVHAGAPKTGTKAFQDALYRYDDALVRQAVWCPPQGAEPGSRWHRPLAKRLLTADFAGFANAFAASVRAAPATAHTMVLSMEGLYNGWWDAPSDTTVMLRHIARFAHVALWLVVREPLAWALSYYAQVLVNSSKSCASYGRDASLEDMLADPWFARRMDVGGFVADARSIVGDDHVRLFRYGDDIVQRLFAALGVAAVVEPARVHRSLSAAGIALLRIVNRYDLPTAEKREAVKSVFAIDGLLGDRGEPLRASDAAAERIRALTEDGWTTIQGIFDEHAGAGSP